MAEGRGALRATPCHRRAARAAGRAARAARAGAGHTAQAGPGSAGHGPGSAGHGPGRRHGPGSTGSQDGRPGQDGTGRGQGEPEATAGSRPPRGRQLAERLRGNPGRWLAIFGVALGGLLIRFLVPTPVGQADNRDGPRLMCGLGLGPVTGHHPRFFRYSYFEYVPKRECAGRVPYPSSELIPLEVGRVLTPVLGLHGALNLIAVGAALCALAAVAIASLAVGLRIPLWAQLLVAAACWLIIADAAFFDVFGGPFSEPAALVGLMLVAAGLVYLGRGWRLTMSGLALAGSGGFLAILSKEQYLVMAAPICITLVLASAGRGPWRGLRRFRTRQAAAAILVAAALAVMAGAYALWDNLSSYGQRLHHIQAVDMLFTDIVTRRSTAPAQLRALGLPVSWARYAGHYYWDTTSVRQSPLYPKYTGQLTDGNITHYLVTHPGSMLSVGQSAAIAGPAVPDHLAGRLPRVRRPPERRVRVPAGRGDLADAPASAGPGPVVVRPAVAGPGWP